MFLLANTNMPTCSTRLACSQVADTVVNHTRRLWMILSSARLALGRLSNSQKEFIARRLCLSKMSAGHRNKRYLTDSSLQNS